MFAGVLEVGFADVVELVALFDLDVGHVGFDGCGYVRAERPRGRRPDEQGVTGLIDDRKGHKDGRVANLAVAFVHFHLREARAAPRAPRHDVFAAIDQLSFVTLLEKRPDAVVVLVRHRVIGMFPVHPIAETLGLLRLEVGELAGSCFAFLDELVDAKGFDLLFVFKAVLFFDLDLDPEPLAVETVLISKLFPPTCGRL